MAAIHRPDNGPLYKEPFADSDTEATFRAPFLLPLSLFHSRSTAAKTRRNRGMPSTSTAPPPPFPLPSSPLPSSRPPPCHLADYYAFLSFRFFDNSPPSRNSSFVRQKYRRGKGRERVLSSNESGSITIERFFFSIDRLSLMSVKEKGRRRHSR